MSKKRRNHSKKGVKRNSIRPLLIQVFEKKQGDQITHKEICQIIDARDPNSRQNVFDELNMLVKHGSIERVNHFTFKSLQNSKYLEGNIDITQRGAGFVSVEGEERDVYIAPQNTNRALQNDQVRIKIIKEGKSRDEGVVVEVLKRDKVLFVGELRISRKDAVLIPDNHRMGTEIIIPLSKTNGAKHGQKVLAKITAWPKGSNTPYGEVSTVLGASGSNDAEMLSILYNHGIEPEFPQEVIDEAEYVKIELDSDEIKRRRDFRKTLTVTIDPLDARDFDDAISIERMPNGNLEIGVHIADVSHYVKPNSHMDKEAVKRSNSVYLVDRVIPMLPEQLSNVACSLRPHEDKYTFSAVFEMDESGKVFKEWYGKGVIHSDRRFTYEEAQEIIMGAEGDHASELKLLDKIAKVMRKRRLKNGALSIESEEMRFKLGENGFPEGILIKTSKDAHKLVEEFMLLANRHVAMFLGKPTEKEQKTTCIYRVHDTPDPAKLDIFSVFIKKFGYSVDLTQPESISKNINKLLGDIRLKNEYSMIQSMAIRSMAKATYEVENIGHYGLAFPYYTHFTSPIRRYADLIIHRMLETKLSKSGHKFDKGLEQICKHISSNEKKASESERESTKYFHTLFVQEFIGEEFEGVISGIADHGMYVRMDENHCEGMVPMNAIPGDRFRFDQDSFRIVGSRTKKEYNFGDRVKVRIYEVSPRKRQVDLELIEV
jgi:ribonuclease R